MVSSHRTDAEGRLHTGEVSSHTTDTEGRLCPDAMVSDTTVENVVYVQMSSNDTGSLVRLGEFTYLWQMQKVGCVQMQRDTTDMTDAEGSLRPGELKRGRCAGTEVCCAVVHTLHGRTAESCAPLYSTPSSHTVPPPETTTDKSSVHHSTALLHTAISHSASS